MIKSHDCKKLLKKIKLNAHFFKKLPPHEKRMTRASMITLLRFILVPPLVGTMIWQAWGTAAILFMIAALSDACDGLWARCFNEKTVLGACLDPLADKCLVLSCFATLVCVQPPLFVVPHFFVMALLCKELLQVSGLLIVWAIHGHIEIHPTILGKVTTGLQMLFIMWLFLCYYFHWLPEKNFYYTLLGGMMILIVSTFVQYVRMGIKYIAYSLCD